MNSVEAILDALSKVQTVYDDSTEYIIEFKLAVSNDGTVDLSMLEFMHRLADK